jgi:hypothetical protein
VYYTLLSVLLSVLTGKALRKWADEDVVPLRKGIIKGINLCG